MKNAPDKIVFYDGDCGFCNKSVQLVMKYQKEATFHFSAIQSDYTQALFKEKKWKQPDLTTLYFSEEGRLFDKSDAVLKISSHLRFPFNLVQFTWVFPQFFRDKIYDFIAKRRHKLSDGFCVVPTANNKKQFLS